MKNYTKILTLLLVALMLLQASAFGSTAPLTANVYAEYIEEASASTKQYDYSSSQNSGKRHEIATTLDGTSADDYYEGIYEYEILSQQSQSEILSSLRDLMTDTHHTNTSYAQCKSDAKYTDGELDQIGVSLIYTSVFTTSALSGNSTWNREHVWPKSLGGFDESGPGSDMHHIRPSDCVVNSTRNNYKYGVSINGKSVYDANFGGNNLGGYLGGGYYEPLDNVKGDVARICLYMYVRYGDSWSKCSNITNVFQSVEVLLEWCELDPVDTWELGRNEVIQNKYQGNRNVFIDYPEYAWLIFGEEIPEDMTTPSGEAKNGGSSSHTCVWDNGTVTVESTCTETGVMIYTCTDCGEIKTEVIEALGHSYDTSGCCTLCGQLNVNYRFIAAVDSLNGLSGKELYEGICDALRIYAELPDESKEDVADKYFDLKGFVAAYNGDVVVTNSYADLISTRAVGISVTVTTLSLALFCLFRKKHV